MTQSLRALLIACLACGFAWAPQARAEDALDCHLKFNLEGWSAFYKTASGTGVVSCSNGDHLPVTIVSRGGGLTFGKSRITDGVGEFTGIANIHDVLGSYAAAEAHIGAVKSRQVQVVTKGNVSLALKGKGDGWDIGVSLASFTLKPR
ncbi:hypothetical protein [Solilutibacter silvestris]|nr:hypothetical protein [Lysobacter silvestris]